MTLIYRSQSYPVGQAREIGRVETYLGTTVTGQPVQYATPLHPFNGMIPNNQLSQLYDQASVTDMKQKVIDEEKYKCDKDKAKLKEELNEAIKKGHAEYVNTSEQLKNTPENAKIILQTDLKNQLTAAADAKTDEITKLEATLAAADAKTDEITKLEATLAAADATISAKILELNTAQGHIDILSKKIEYLESSLDGLPPNAKDEFLTLSNELKDAKTEKNKSESAIAQLTSHLNDTMPKVEFEAVKAQKDAAETEAKEAAQALAKAVAEKEAAETAAKEAAQALTDAVNAKDREVAQAKAAETAAAQAKDAAAAQALAKAVAEKEAAETAAKEAAQALTDAVNAKDTEAAQAVTDAVAQAVAAKDTEAAQAVTDAVAQAKAAAEKELEEANKKIKNLESNQVTTTYSSSAPLMSSEDALKFSQYKKLYTDDPYQLFNLLLIFIFNDISIYLKNLTDEETQILVLLFIPLLTLFTQPDKYKIVQVENMDTPKTSDTYVDTNYIIFKKLFNILFSDDSSPPGTRAKLLEKIIYTFDDDLDKIKEIINLILSAGLYKLLDSNSAKKYSGESDYDTFKNVYLQTCVNIYLYETKQYSLSELTTNKKKFKSILTFIMRLYMNTLPYYIHNLLYYIIMSSGDHDLLKEFKANVSEFNKLLNPSSVAREDDIYTTFYDLITKILTDSAPAPAAPAAASAAPAPATSAPATASDVEKYIYKLCIEYYYKNTNCDHYLLKKGNRGIFLGGTDNFPPSEDEKTVSNLAKISFKNPYYLLNHVSMELCLLQKFYDEINDKLSNDETFNEEMKQKIKSFYNDVIKGAIKDVKI